MVLGGLLLLGLAVWREARAKEPIIPLRLFRDKNTTLATIASLFVGIALFGATVFLSQYFQISRGKSPTVAGLMSLPMIFGLVVSSIVVGRIITHTGRYKRWMVMGGVLLTVGMALLGTMNAHTSLWVIAAWMALVGLGLGATMQNLVLAVQNTVAQSDLGSASATVAFFRSLGGAIGVSVMGAVLAHQVAGRVASGLAHLGASPAAGGASGAIPDVSKLPPAVRHVVENAYGVATAHIFLAAAPVALIALLAIVAMTEVPLRRTLDLEAETAPEPVEAGS
jgi:MFS family permease